MLLNNLQNAVINEGGRGTCSASVSLIYYYLYYLEKIVNPKHDCLCNQNMAVFMRSMSFPIVPYRNFKLLSDLLGKTDGSPGFSCIF